jgi:hypothetical protein
METRYIRYVIAIKGRETREKELRLHLYAKEEDDDLLIMKTAHNTKHKEH